MEYRKEFYIHALTEMILNCNYTKNFFYRVLSGAFDKVVKVWSQDGQVMHKFDGFR